MFNQNPLIHKRIHGLVKSSLLTYVLILLTGNCAAIDIGEDAELHGFASLGYINSDNNPFYGDTLGGSFELQEAAVNALWEPSEAIRLTGQMLYRNTGTLSQKHFNLDFLMADIKVYEQEANLSGVRLGRVKTPLGLYNSSRDIPHGRPGIFVPKSVYFDSFRDTLLAVDGANLYSSLYNDWGYFNIQLYAGRSKLKNNSIEHYLFSEDIQGSFDHAYLKGFQVLFEPDKIPGLKLGYSLVDVNISLENGAASNTQQLGQNYAMQYLYANAANLFSPSPQEIEAAQQYAQQALANELTNNFRAHLNDIEVDAYIHVISAQYLWRSLTFTGEYIQVESKVTTNIAATGNQSKKTTSQGYYFQVEWQATEQLSLLARYERLYLNTSDKDGSKGFASGILVSPYTHYAKGYTIGARWYFNSDTSITTEYSHSTGAAWLPKDDDIDVSQLGEDWNYLGVQVSYHF